MFNILIAEDDKHLRKLMEIHLRDNQYQVYCAANGADALEIMYGNTIDLMIIDIMMPIMDGYELVRQVRKIFPNIPAIMVTAKNGIDDIRNSFDIGVDDYMIKPINFDELLMRIKAVLRRAKIANERKIVINGVTLDYNNFSISDNNNNVVKLPNKEFLILYKLMSYPNQVFTKSEIYEEFWGINSDTDENTIKVHINNIRKHIKNIKGIGIENVRGFGYKGVKYE